MGGFFGIAAHQNCVQDVFFGVDYHSHLGTKRAGMAAYNSDDGFQRDIHNIANSPFRTKFERVCEETEHIKVAHVVNIVRAMQDLKDAGLWFTGLDWGEDAKPYTKIDFKGRVGLVVGAEGRGISRLVRENCDFIAELPMPGGFESLNAGVATAVTLYEVLRQRS